DYLMTCYLDFFFQAEDGIRDLTVTGVQTCALPICYAHAIGQRAQRRTGEAGAAAQVERVRIAPAAGHEWCGQQPRRLVIQGLDRSEERRVGKECRSLRTQSN